MENILKFLDLGSLLALLIAVAVPALASLFYAKFEEGKVWLEKLKPQYKRIIVALVTWFVVKLAAATGYVLDLNDITALTDTQLTEMLSVGLAFLFKTQDQNKEMLDIQRSNTGK